VSCVVFETRIATQALCHLGRHEASCYVLRLLLWFSTDWITATQCLPVYCGQQSRHYSESRTPRLHSSWASRHGITLHRRWCSCVGKAETIAGCFGS